jgi:chromosome segregation ATPase
VADNPFVTLARVLGGVVLMQGRLGHQVLGQLLVTGSHEVTIAGASLVIAATAREKDAVSQAVIRTLAPAVAIHALTHREDKRIRAAQRELDRRRIQLAAATRGLDVRNAEIALLQATVSRQKRDVDALEGEVTARGAAVAAREADLQETHRQLTADLERYERVKREDAERMATLEGSHQTLTQDLAACLYELSVKDAARSDVDSEIRRLTAELEELSARLRQPEGPPPADGTPPADSAPPKRRRRRRRKP